ncbi:MAG: SBBP repeat-containing protein [Solirubrobacterales bacterium]
MTAAALAGALVLPGLAAADPIPLGQIGSPGSGAGQLDNPSSVAIDGAGNVYIGESGNLRISVFEADGSFLKTIGGAGVARASRAVSAGTVKLKVKPAKKGKRARKIRRALRHKGKAKVKALVTYLPTGGTANAQGRKLKLVRK